MWYKPWSKITNDEVHIFWSLESSYINRRDSLLLSEVARTPDNPPFLYSDKLNSINGERKFDKLGIKSDKQHIMKRV